MNWFGPEQYCAFLVENEKADLIFWLQLSCLQQVRKGNLVMNTVLPKKAEVLHFC